MNIPIIFEDSELIAVDKPSGVAVNRSENEKSATLQDWAEENFFPKDDLNQRPTENLEKSDFVKRAGIVHRLDKETSGLLLIAKNEDAFKDVQKQFLERTVKKTYIALVHGKIGQDNFTINAPVGRLPWNRRKFGVIPDGREAETEVKVIKLLQNSKKELFTLVEAKPATGRTHQIRIHLKHIGHPIVSDPLYAGRKVLRADLKFCPRLFLHAAKLKITHPESSKILFLESKLPYELNGVILRLDNLLTM